MADDQARVDRLTEAIKEREPVEVFRGFLQQESLDWVARALRSAADLGVGPDAAVPIISEILGELRAFVAASIDHRRN